MVVHAQSYATTALRCRHYRHLKSPLVRPYRDTALQTIRVGIGVTWVQAYVVQA